MSFSRDDPPKAEKLLVEAIMIESELKTRAETRLTYGMVGGGQGAFIGDVHRKAIAFDGNAEIVCGCFSSDPENTIITGLSIGIPEDRLYNTYMQMAKAEGQRNDKIDFVVIVTPNSTHYPIAKLFLENNINVVCDKPFTVTSVQARELEKLAEQKGLSICVTYTYTGYPLAKQAREMIKNGELGDIRFVNAEYPQEWLSTLLEETDHKQANWRANPEKTGPTNSVGDIGSHIENLVSFMTGLKIKRLSARLDSIVDGRTLDDNATIMLDYRGGAKGLYWCSQIAIGNDNGLKVRVFGSEGSLEWAQENPNYMKISYLDKPTQIISRGRDTLYPVAELFSRVPAGHPEGYFEAFANIYRSFTSFLIQKKSGNDTLQKGLGFPQATNGEAGVKFIEACVKSSLADAAWVEMTE